MQMTKGLTKQLSTDLRWVRDRVPCAQAGGTRLDGNVEEQWVHLVSYSDIGYTDSAL